MAKQINTAANPAFVDIGTAVASSGNLPDPAQHAGEFYYTTNSPKQLFFSNGLAWWAIAALE